MTSNEKILTVMDLLRERVNISAKGPSANLDENDFALVGIKPSEARIIVKKLVDEHSCVYVWIWPEDDEKREVFIDERIREYHSTVQGEKELAHLRKKIKNELVPHNIYNYDLEENFEATYMVYKAKAGHDKVRLEPRSYDAANGLLFIGQTKVMVIGQKSQKGRLKESKEAQLMRILFKDVNSMKDGIPLSKLTPVRNGVIDAASRKKVKNYIAQVNKKVAHSLGDKSMQPLIKSNKHAAWINDSYL